jgi:hypothetical protein
LNSKTLFYFTTHVARVPHAPRTRITAPHRTLDLTDTSPTPHRHHNDDQFSFFFAITHRAHRVVRSAGNHDDT